MFCMHCGKEMDGNFCPYCGAPAFSGELKETAPVQMDETEFNTQNSDSQPSNRGSAKPYLYGRVYGNGPTADYTNKLRTIKNFLIILCIILFCAILVLSLSLFSHIENEGHLETLLSNEIQANKDLRDKQTENRSAEEKADFLDKNIALCVDEDYVYYHTYDCDDFQNCDKYIAYNVYQAEVLDYVPCPKCH